MAALGAHTLRTQIIPKGPKPIAAIRWVEVGEVRHFKGGQNSFPSFRDWFLAGGRAGGDSPIGALGQ